jgi:hypothetical protein
LHIARACAQVVHIVVVTRAFDAMSFVFTHASLLCECVEVHDSLLSSRDNRNAGGATVGQAVQSQQ